MQTMTPMAAAITFAILVSAILGVYLLRRQIAAVAAHRDATPADFAGAVTLEEHRRAADYTIAKARLSIGETLYETMLSVAWLLLWLAPLHAIAAHYVEPGLTRSVLIVVGFGAASYLLSLPVSLARIFWLEAQFDFNRLTPSLFAADEIKGLVLQLALALPMLYGMFALLRALPDTWWLLAYAAFMGFMLLMMVIYPTLIAPLFNKFTPLADAEKKRRMEALLEKCGFEAKGLFVMDASKRSTHGNAYFSGFGKAKRIVFFDTLLEKHSMEEIEAILAHELGHYKFGHIRQTIAQTAALAFVGFFILHWAFAGGLPEWLGLPNDPGVVFAALLIAKDPVLHLLSPVLAWRSRKAEFEADDFARKMCGEAPMISALTRLTRDNLATLTPDRVYAAFYYSHPPVPERVAHLRGT